MIFPASMSITRFGAGAEGCEAGAVSAWADPPKTIIAIVTAEIPNLMHDSFRLPIHHTLLSCQKFYPECDAL